MHQKVNKSPVFLVIAHDQPKLLHSLIQRLSPNLVFLHLSLACDRAEFINILGRQDNVRILEEKDSFLTAWGGLNLVRAQIALGDYASRYVTENDYLVWISGRDYPIKPIDDFVEFINSSPLCDFIGFFSINEFTPHYSEFISKKYFYDTTEYFIKLLKLPNIFRRIANKLLNGRIRKSGKSSLCFEGRAIVYGYPRFALRNSTYIEMRRQLDNNYWNYFKDSHAPDDMFIHSLFYNSNIQSVAQPGLTPFDSIEPIKSIESTIPDIWCKEYHIGIVDDSSLEHLKTCNAFFARKFDEDISENVLHFFER